MAYGSGIRIRPARVEDLSVLHHLLTVNDLAGAAPFEESWVAEVSGRIVGFIRIEVVGQHSYVRPVVVAPPAQGGGVGRLLIEHLRTQYSELRVVARGQVVGFYLSLDFQPMGWENVPLDFYQECALCPELARCQPLPLKWINKTK